jgi:hypothetical protein
VDISCCGASYDGEAYGHAERGAHEHLAASEDVVETCAGGCEYPACDGVDGVEEELSVCVRYANVLNEER